MIASSLFVAAMACGTASAAADQPQQPCCFTNPRYSGVCREVPAEDETCAGILDYLNNANAVGKAYCDNSSVRGGWQQVPCEAPAEGATAEGADSDG